MHDARDAERTLDFIVFAPGIDGTRITLGSQLPAATAAVTITGNGAAATIFEASTCNQVTLLGGRALATQQTFQCAGFRFHESFGAHAMRRFCGKRRLGGPLVEREIRVAVHWMIRFRPERRLVDVKATG